MIADIILYTCHLIVDSHMDAFISVLQSVHIFHKVQSQFFFLACPCSQLQDYSIVSQTQIHGPPESLALY